MNSKTMKAMESGKLGRIYDLNEARRYPSKLPPASHQHKALDNLYN